MAVTSSDLGAPARLDWKRPTAPRTLHWTDHLRWALAVGWVAFVVWAVLVGARTSTFAQLEADLAAGRTAAVQVADSGGGLQTVTWQAGWLQRHLAEVVVQPDGSADGEVFTTGGGQTVLQRSAADLVQAAHPGVVVDRVPRNGLTGELLGFRFPAGWPYTAALVGGALVTLFLVMNVPPPWRLTRWAWFWIAFTPVGMLVFALFAGPTPLLPHPARPERRLTGGWAFLLSLLLAPLLRWGAQR